MTIWFVLFGGLLGVLARYGCLIFFPSVPFITILMINALGSFLIGYTYKLDMMWPFLAIGFCGAFTTYSTYSLDCLKFIQYNQWGLLATYIMTTNVLCILMCWFGFKFR